MGNSTDYVGRVGIDPPLNDREIAYLTALMATSYDDREEVAFEPPSARCGWRLGDDGRSLVWDADADVDEMIVWLRYLIAHFLKPRARAVGTAGVEGFTFDHVVEGIVVGCQRDSGGLTQITVRRNRVTAKRLRLPEEKRPTAPAPPSARRPPAAGTGQGQVIDLLSRRRIHG